MGRWFWRGPTLMPRKKPGRRADATDLTDTQWALIAPLMPEAEPGGRPRKASTRELVNAILYFLRAGMAWRLLPHDLPPWQTVYYYLRRWQREGVWERAFAAASTFWVRSPMNLPPARRRPASDAA